MHENLNNFFNDKVLPHLYVPSVIVAAFIALTFLTTSLFSLSHSCDTPLILFSLVQSVSLLLYPVSFFLSQKHIDWINQHLFLLAIGIAWSFGDGTMSCFFPLVFITRCYIYLFFILLILLFSFIGVYYFSKGYTCAKSSPHHIKFQVVLTFLAGIMAVTLIVLNFLYRSFHCKVPLCLYLLLQGLSLLFFTIVNSKLLRKHVKYGYNQIIWISILVNLCILTIGVVLVSIVDQSSCYSELFLVTRSSIGVLVFAVSIISCGYCMYGTRNDEETVPLV
ncbi:hypothetical protein RCL1_005602 [Eukaryota sp. TZLM3-RCL]